MKAKQFVWALRKFKARTNVRFVLKLSGFKTQDLIEEFDPGSD
jgi:hypothetical protein